VGGSHERHSYPGEEMMKTESLLHIKNSIATRLMRIVFGIYIVIAIAVTLFHMRTEYQYQKNSISRDLENIQKTFEHVLAVDIWHMDHESMRSTLAGMLEIPVIVGVRIQGVDGKDLAIGGIISRHGEAVNFDQQVNLLGLSRDVISNQNNESHKFDVFEHTFPIIYSHNEKSEQLGKAIIYSSTSVVFQRVKVSFVLLILNAIIKTGALWVIFIICSNILLRRPLSLFIAAAQNITPENLGSFKVDIKTSKHNELKVLEESFNSMIENLHHSIVERKQTKDALANQTELLDNILNNIPHNVFWKDRQSVYLGCNKAFAKVTGVGEPANIIGKTDYDLPWKKEEADSYRAFDKKVMDTVTPMVDIEEPLTQADGLEKTVITSKVPLRDQNGNVFGTLGIYYDITERKQMEETIKQTQKMEAIGTLAGGIAHDFNNILAAIVGYAELAHEASSKNKLVSEYLDAILKSSFRAKDLVRQILTFSRKSQEERKPIQLYPIIKESTKLLRSTIPATIEIRQNIDETMGMVNADPTQMFQIVMNLCTNAAHAIHDNEGVIDISLSTIIITQELMQKYHNVSPGPFLELKISDNGSGIDSKIIHRIFEPFFTTKNKLEGTGMGLAVVHGIIKDYGGDIIVDSQLNKGTTFTVLLPQVIAEADRGIDSVSEIPTGNARILFVDDEEMLIDVGKKMLNSLGYDVTALNSSIEAFETFQNSPDEFDMIISDHTMPHMTGYTMAKRILEIKPSARIILCTGYSDAITPEKVAAAGIKALVYKPISRAKIAKTIHDVLHN
jgi:PAS domain S-box-containing protein